MLPFQHFLNPLHFYKSSIAHLEYALKKLSATLLITYILTVNKSVAHLSLLWIADIFASMSKNLLVTLLITAILTVPSAVAHSPLFSSAVIKKNYLQPCSLLPFLQPHLPLLNTVANFATVSKKLPAHHWKSQWSLHICQSLSKLVILTLHHKELHIDYHFGNVFTHLPFL